MPAGFFNTLFRRASPVFGCSVLEMINDACQAEDVFGGLLK